MSWRLRVTVGGSCNMIKGRRVYGSLEEAKTYVLARREELQTENRS